MKNEKYTEAGRKMLGFLKSEAEKKGITNQAISDKTGFTQPNVNRILNGRYSPTLDNFLNLADAIHVKVELKSIALKSPVNVEIVPKCDICGHDMPGKPFPIYDKQYHVQPGIGQCEGCFKLSLLK